MFAVNGSDEINNQKYFLATSLLTGIIPIDVAFVETEDGFMRTPTPLWFALVGDSGAGKSKSFQVVTNALHSFEQALDTAGVTNQPYPLETPELGDDAQESEERVLVFPRYTIFNCGSLSASQSTLADRGQVRRLLLVSTEFRATISSFLREGKQVYNNLAASWSGESDSKIGAEKSRSVSGRRNRMGFVTAMQPIVLHDLLMKDEAAAASGAIGRIMAGFVRDSPVSSSQLSPQKSTRESMSSFEEMPASTRRTAPPSPNKHANMKSDAAADGGARAQQVARARSDFEALIVRDEAKFPLACTILVADRLQCMVADGIKLGYMVKFDSAAVQHMVKFKSMVLDLFLCLFVR